MYLVTGGAGFIGSNLIKFLTQSTSKEICMVDWETTIKKKNLSNINNLLRIKPEELKKFLKKNEKKIDIIFHLGAITSTTETNPKLIIDNNIELSFFIWNWCVEKKTRLIYASSAATYGNGESGFKDLDEINYLKKLKPLNLYGWSKHLIDQFFLKESIKGNKPPQWVGLKFFNVYGPNEYHKGDMQSIIFKIFNKIAKNEDVFLFKSHKKSFLNGEQLRDFIYIKDVIKVIQWFMDNKKLNGIFNVGNGTARTFNDLASAVFKYSNVTKKIRYIDTPKKIRDKYQYFTKAEMSKLKKSGYSQKNFTLESGIEDYIFNYLHKKDKYL